LNIYDTVTDQILKELEAGTPPWVKSWQSNLPQNYISKKEYRGTNVLLLWAAASKKGYISPYWLTFKQAGDLKSRVKKGEKATWIVYAAKGYRAMVGPDDEQIQEEYRFLKWYHVFNLEQTEGIPIPEVQVKRPSQVIEGVESFIASLGAEIIIGGNKAFYGPKLDEIHLPDPKDFKDMAHYYATSLHEHVHWTAHPSRLNRILVYRRDTEEYAQEELIAELGSSFLCSHLQIPSRLREDHAAYIGHWIQILKDDKRAIFKASALAAKAADYLREKAGEFDLQEAV
jgi:antirestriction protein ArdC